MHPAKAYGIAALLLLGLFSAPVTAPVLGQSEKAQSDQTQAYRGQTYREIMQRRPDLFDPRTGYRIARHRAPSPVDIPPPARPVTAREVQELIGRGAILLDVFSALQSPYDALNGRWLVAKARMSLPGATWLPQTGLGVLSDPLKRYLTSRLQDLSAGDVTRPIVVFCIADCWMSWNAAQRITKLGYRKVYWFRHGTDGWLDNGGKLTPVWPLPVLVD